MKHRIKRILSITLGLVVLFATVQWWYLRPARTAEGFIASLSRGRYEKAQAMLAAPSSIEAAENGELVLTDWAGNATTVPAQNLPFLSAQLLEDEPSRDSAVLPPRVNEFTMVALGESEGGILLNQPVRLYLQADGGKVHIEKVD
jgi:hypothetical protein